MAHARTGNRGRMLLQPKLCAAVVTSNKREAAAAQERQQMMLLLHFTRNLVRGSTSDAVKLALWHAASEIGMSKEDAKSIFGDKVLAHAGRNFPPDFM